MAGTIVADTLTHSTAGSIATNYVVNGSAKAWILCNYSTAAVTDDFNFSSITDQAVGRFACSFTASMNNATYVTTASGSDESAGPVSYVQHSSSTKTSSQVAVTAIDRSGNAYDTVKMEFAIHGELA